MNIEIHKVKSIDVLDVITSTNTERVYGWRDIIIIDEKGNKHCLVLFADDIANLEIKYERQDA